MAITGEFCRKQFFTGEVEPRQFLHMATNVETMTHLTTEELKEVVDVYQLELNKREHDNGNSAR